MHHNPAASGLPDCMARGDRCRGPRTPGAMPRLLATLRRAHVLPRDDRAWNGLRARHPSAPTRSSTREPGFVRLHQSPATCAWRASVRRLHLPILHFPSERSLMATSAMRGCGAAYNNGILPSALHPREASRAKGMAHRSWGGWGANPVCPDASSLEGILPSSRRCRRWKRSRRARVFRSSSAAAR